MNLENTWGYTSPPAVDWHLVGVFFHVGQESWDCLRVVCGWFPAVPVCI